LRAQPWTLPGLTIRHRLKCNLRLPPDAGLAAFEGQDPKVRKAEMNKGGTFIRAANVHLIAGDLERAIEQYDRAIGLNPENALYYYARGLARLKSREFARAVEDFKQATNAQSKILHGLLRPGASPRWHQ